MEHDRLVQLAKNKIKLTSSVQRVRESSGSYQIDNDPVIELVNKIIDDALHHRASDIHLEPMKNGLCCRIRVDGQLQSLYESLPEELKDFVVSRIKVMGGMDIAEHRVPQDGRFIHEAGGREIDVRVSVIPLINGEKIVMRLLNNTQRYMGLEEMEFSHENKRLLQDLIHAPNGAVIVAGPVNSGKTTTLYAALKEVMSGKENIITIEDPVEYQLEGVNQMQVNSRTGLTFASGLRACLRQDSDLIMLGEIRDEETANIAMRAALTGHLIFTTLHTGSAAEAVFRLLDMGIKGYVLSAAVRGVVAQRLVRRLCPKCRKKIRINRININEKLSDEALKDIEYLYSSAGCNECDGTGYKGRLAIHEIMLMSDELSEALKNDDINLKLVEEVIKNNGMKTLWQNGLEKVIQGETSLDELHRVLG